MYDWVKSRFIYGWWMWRNVRGSSQCVKMTTWSSATTIVLYYFHSCFVYCVKWWASFLFLYNFNISGSVQQSISSSVLSFGPASFSCHNRNCHSSPIIRVVSYFITYISAFCKLLHIIQAFSGLFSVLESVQSWANDPGQNRRLTDATSSKGKLYVRIFYFVTEQFRTVVTVETFYCCTLVECHQHYFILLHAFIHFIKISSIQTAQNYLPVDTLTSFLLIFPFSCIWG